MELRLGECVLAGGGGGRAGLEGGDDQTAWAIAGGELITGSLARNGSE